MTTEEKYPLLIGRAVDENKRLHNAREVADFIHKHGRYGDVDITLEDGTPFINTIGSYINTAADKEYRDEVIKEIMHLNAAENANHGRKQPLTVKNLAVLKRIIKPGIEITASYHAYHPQTVGLTRVVTQVQSNAFYSVIKNQPHHKFSICNDGKGFRTEFGKASEYIFDGGAVKVLNSRDNDSVLWEFEVFEGEYSFTEDNTEEEQSDDIDEDDSPQFGGLQL